MPELDWWQWVTTVGGTLIVLDRLAGVLERLGLLRGKFLDWGRRYYKERMAAEARQIAVDALLTNGIRGRVEEAAADAKSAADAAAEAVALAQGSASLMRQVLADHITQSMEEHAGLAQQMTKLERMNR